MEGFSEDSVFAAETGNEINMVPDGCMIYQPSRERVHYLNPTAVVVYELSGAGTPLKQIEAFMQQGYGLPDSPIEAVRSCLDMLVKEGLIVPCRSSASAR